MELTLEKSAEQGEWIKLISIYLQQLDADYLEACGNKMGNQASRQESMAVLNPNHPQLKNDILRAKAKALLTLVAYKKELIEISKMESRLKEESQTRETINKFFI